ncbi:MAG TPA: polymer-forming cytoskeletal protein [Saprospiraceae bacterium]|nr:polymer-forming cytoskeletal protein [Saprospiraceae bacterium]HMP23962.1 polymer-forming cytoskeletal protein [Saprospiraceae bacterium]
MALLDTKAKPKADVAAAAKTSLPPSSSANCVVAKGTKIEGNFRSPENIRLDGTVVGEVRCDKKLVMGEGSLVEGKIFAQDAVVMGAVKGDVQITETLHLQGTAKIEGNITAKAMIVDEGAVFNGDCKVGA